ncbi:MAG TPA: HypC/HybG/HupF family hydrogenase formation chaperone [Candidatus Aminicenantes bacterium]|nr:HypC/HybG/HupF family hydrogenase formation chaperone [Candidatus Aminicenantes bacterium]HRY66257.1 HypC/HybG/HupF family hydrogenase formation chaperone [Candidatus Aminicenantes bacterium]HRZ73171.1 HypC/HybG/HupF family hydrogenase formation chaperone [Candidatus Aminicenantes bacterium]
MCLAVPARIARIDAPGQGTASYMGSQVKVNLSLVPQARQGDWVIIHAGFAISVMDEKEARETLRLFKEMAAAFPDEAA